MPRTSQFQLDVYGELMDTFEQARKGGLAPTESGWELQLALIEHVARTGASPTTASGRRAGRRMHFVYSKVMAWVAFDRAIKGVERSWPARPCREMARHPRPGSTPRSASKGFDAERNTFRAAYGSDLLDASLLLMAQAGFVDARRSALHRHGRGDRARAAASTASSCATTPTRPTTACAGRRRVPGLQLLAGRRLCLGRPAGRRREAVRAPARRSATISGCWPRNTTRANSRLTATSRRPSSHVGADQHRLQPDPRRPSPPSSAPTVNGSDRRRKRPRAHAAGNEMAEPGGPSVRRRAASSRVSLTALGLALPPVDFMTWPTNQPNRVGLAL